MHRLVMEVWKTVRRREMKPIIISSASHPNHSQIKCGFHEFK
jgi:hypothetical protein